MNVGSAVQTWPDGDVESLIENAAQFRGRQRFIAEAQCGHTPCHVAMPEDSIAVKLIQAAPQSFREIDLVPSDLLQALILHILDARRKARDAQYIGRAPFKEIGKFLRLRFIG